MSIASEITRLQTAKSDLKTSIENKGVTVPSATLIDGYASLVDQISTGSGREYEAGIYTPAEDISNPTIYFAKTHDHLPLLITLVDVGDTYVPEYSVINFSFIFWDNVLGHCLASGTSTRYGLTRYTERAAAANSQLGGSNLSYPETQTASGSTIYPRYFASESSFRPYLGASYYYHPGRTYKWIAVW